MEGVRCGLGAEYNRTRRHRLVPRRPVSEGDDTERHREQRRGIYVEDALILISIGLLFWLGVLERHETWAQIAMGVLLLVMLMVFVRRVRRVRRAFKE